MATNSTHCVDPCRNIQLLEPTDQTLVLTSSGSADLSLDESGTVLLSPGMDGANVVFEALKAGEYRFEYLYIDALGTTNPGDIEPVVTLASAKGFVANFTGSPLEIGYTLRWRVVVIFPIEPIPGVDAPESFRLQLPINTNLYTVTFRHLRTSEHYDFSELRIENLDDAPAAQTIVSAQVVGRTDANFTVALNPSPPTSNYYLVARIE